MTRVHVGRTGVADQYHRLRADRSVGKVRHAQTGDRPGETRRSLDGGRGTGIPETHRAVLAARQEHFAFPESGRDEILHGAEVPGEGHGR
ncbi:hypothetical protein AMK33_26395 [Streptomyces sp. CB02400]|nr:hypothetical protein AMK33_26395 [Streptomyces sp. CB02400]